MVRTSALTAPNPPLTNLGELNRQFPILTRFSDGDQVSTWVAALRVGSELQPDIIEQLDTHGWTTHEAELVGCSVNPTRFVKSGGSIHLSRFVVSRSIDYGIQPDVRLLTRAVHSPGKLLDELDVVVTEKESSLFHGHIKAKDTPIRLYLDHRPGQPHYVLVRNS